MDNFYSEVIPRWKIIDYNYDGYKDIICYSRYDLARGNLYYTGWILHSDTEQFEQVEIEDISNLIIDSEQQVLSGLSWGPGDYEYAIYKIIDGKVIKTNTLTFNYRGGPAYHPETNELRYNYIDFENGNRAKIESQELKGNQLVDVFPELICDTEEGRQQVYNYIYDESSIWFKSMNEYRKENGENGDLRIERNPETEDWN